MTPIEIPLDAVGEALVAALWTGLATPLGLKTCHQSIYEQLFLSDNIAAEIPALRVMEPLWQGGGAKGSNPFLPVVDGKISFLVAYCRTFAATDTAEVWSRQLMQDVQLITTLLWPGDGQIPGFSPPSGLKVLNTSITSVAAAASPADEDLAVRLAEAQIRVNIDVQLRGER